MKERLPELIRCGNGLGLDSVGPLEYDSYTITRCQEKDTAVLTLKIRVNVENFEGDYAPEERAERTLEKEVAFLRSRQAGYEQDAIDYGAYVEAAKNVGVAVDDILLLIYEKGRDVASMMAAKYKAMADALDPWKGALYVYRYDDDGNKALDAIIPSTPKDMWKS